MNKMIIIAALLALGGCQKPVEPIRHTADQPGEVVQVPTNTPPIYSTVWEHPNQCVQVCVAQEDSK